MEHKHKVTKSHGLCDTCGYNTLRLPNKELRKKGWQDPTKAKHEALESKRSEKKEHKYGSKANNPEHNKKYWRGQLADELSKK